MGEPKKVLAPMVGASERAFRLLSLECGAQLCVTPMIHARMFGSCPKVRADVLRDVEASAELGDRPLLAQLCGDDAETLLNCARAIAPHVDGVDLNLGCPQGIAKRGHYGAFLLEEPDLVCGIVRHLSQHLDVPVSCKIRLLDPEDPASTCVLARRLVEAGASLVTLHGRTKEMKGQAVGEANWAAVRTVLGSLQGAVPTLANGGVESFEDLASCLDATGACGVMTSEAALEDPAVFDGVGRTPVELADRYLTLAERYPPAHISILKGHVHKLLFRKLQAPGREGCRERVSHAACLDDLRAVVDELRDDVCDDAGSWYRRVKVAAESETVDDVDLGGLFGDG